MLIVDIHCYAVHYQLKLLVLLPFTIQNRRWSQNQVQNHLVRKGCDIEVAPSISCICDMHDPLRARYKVDAMPSI